jgi:hypothetical protein
VIRAESVIINWSCRKRVILLLASKTPGTLKLTDRFDAWPTTVQNSHPYKEALTSVRSPGLTMPIEIR